MAALFVALDELLPYATAANPDFTPSPARARNRAEASIDKAFRFHRLAFLRRLNESSECTDACVDVGVGVKVSTSHGVGRLSSELQAHCEAIFW
eukprot:jgi/Tetstr1/421748/TSEL_001207.t1